ncbi:hypothetical protein FB45DRAFT_1037463 [Roridomyces roridus]|uniref:Uncharacterized protein n=1 Tax=Roridomyces roridus TaxID=1738132 RepID=A0AAD7B6U4_9AGAR|nr:hypothetical protein FB45DRAFT_1037463 [Roridomyces roridus]
MPLYPNGTGTASLMAASCRHPCLPSPCRKVFVVPNTSLPSSPITSVTRIFIPPNFGLDINGNLANARAFHRPTSPRVVGPQREADASRVRSFPQRLSAALRSLFPFPFACSPALSSCPTTMLRIVLTAAVTISPRRLTPLSKRTDDLQVHCGLVVSYYSRADGSVALGVHRWQSIASHSTTTPPFDELVRLSSPSSPLRTLLLATKRIKTELLDTPVSRAMLVLCSRDLAPP